MKQQYLECGKVINKRGIFGELKVECYCDSPDAIKTARVLYGDKDGKEVFDVQSIKDYKGFLYIKLASVTTAEQADLMRGKILFVDRKDVKIEKDSNFIADLVGLEVRDANNGTVYGKVKEVLNYGASDIYVVNDGAKDYMLPAVPGIIVEIDTESHITVNPIQGIFDDAEEIH